MTTDDQTGEFTLNMAMTKGEHEGDVQVTVTFPKDKAILGITALHRAGESKITQQLAAAYQNDPSVKQALEDAGLTIMDGDDE
jgi:hypothetical protein